MTGFSLVANIEMLNYFTHFVDTFSLFKFKSAATSTVSTEHKNVNNLIFIPFFSENKAFISHMLKPTLNRSNTIKYIMNTYLCSLST